MAVRLHMKLGVVAEAERLEGSPDTVAVVEPTVGATSRLKGSLYALASGVGRARRLREATRIVADTVQSEYYYDESAGLSACLERAIRTANRRLAAQRERLGLPVEDGGPIGLGVAVVRGSEVYVATVGPVQAFLLHQAHLLTLPDPEGGRGLPVEDVAPKIWRGALVAGDTLALVSRNLIASVGTDALKDAINTLHPQAAIEQIHRAFIAAGGSGSDGALAIEAAEATATSKRSQLVPLWPREPLAGAPDRSPIPLADSLGGGVEAVSSGIQRARSAVASSAGGFVRAVQDLLPRRGAPRRRVVPAATRREAQRRAAGAVLALVAVASVLGVGLYLLNGADQVPIDEVAAGQRALAAARADLGRVLGDGVDLVEDDPQEAERLLLQALEQLDVAAANNVPAATLRPLREQVVTALDELYGVVEIVPQVAFSFAGQEQTFDLAALVRGPDGMPYVLDRTTMAVYRVDLEGGTATPVIRAGARVGAQEVAEPRHIAVGGRDVLALDANNVLWRWRPADETGKGTLARVRVAESAAWGEDVLGIGTFLRNVETGLYNLYVIDPSEQQVLRYSPALDGSGFPASATGYFTFPRDVDGVTSMVIDGDMFVADAGVVTRYARGRSLDWSLADPPDGILRPPPAHQFLASPLGRSEGLLYSFDPGGERLIAFDKASGRYVAQYRLAAAGRQWRHLRAFYIVDRVRGEAPLVYWIDGETIGMAELRDIADAPPATPDPAAEPGATPSASP